MHITDGGDMFRGDQLVCLEPSVLGCGVKIYSG